jgi:hypothetical protein
MGRQKRSGGGFRFPPQVTANLDQRIAAVTDNLDKAVEGHRDNRRNAADESVAIARSVTQLSVLVMAQGQQGVTGLVDMFTLALSRLADAPDIGAVLDELRVRANTADLWARDSQSEMLAVEHAAEARAYHEAIRIIEAAGG